MGSPLERPANPKSAASATSWGVILCPVYGSVQSSLGAVLHQHFLDTFFGLTSDGLLLMKSFFISIYLYFENDGCILGYFWVL
jgi:hypothetical protein